MVVYVENGGWGATYGVPIGALMMEKYLKGELSPESEAKAAEIQNRRIDYWHTRTIVYGNQWTG